MPAQRLQHIINTIPAKLLAIPEDEFAFKPSPDKWSKKEIIGHLIDSVANNHHRFVRVQFEDDVLTIVYKQNEWNAASRYNEMDGVHIINFWAMYNRHLIEVINRIPQENLQRKVNIGGDEPITLLELIGDYTAHMEHHLRQINLEILY
jgi:hypothetical protein